MTNFTLYKIYYGDYCVYLGRTKQPISARLRGHFFSRPMHKKIDIANVGKIEICNCNTEADMFLYEVYYINKLKPALNCDDKSRDELTIELTELNFIEYRSKRMEVWKAEIEEKNRKLEREMQKINERLLREYELKNETRRTLSEEDTGNG